MSKPVISIIIPVYRVVKYLPSCLDSLLNQDFSLPYNILLIESGSDDGSYDICKEYHQKYSSVYHFHYEKNDGISIGRNLGLLHANGDYVIFMDGDDMVKRDFLSSLYQETLNYPDIQVISAGYSLYDDKKGCVLKTKAGPSYHGRGDKALEKLFRDQKYNFYCWAKLYKRDFLIHNHLVFDETMGMFEDFLFVAKVFACANMVSFIKKSIYLYRQHDESTVHTCKDSLSPYLECLVKIKNYLSIYQSETEKKIFAKPSKKIYKQLKLNCEKSISHYQKKTATLIKEAKDRLKEIY